jgi:L-alanine-DL-glutamate epimerase-like enolase superfamily enzyme
MVAQPGVPLAEYVVIASREDGALRPLYPYLRGVPQPENGSLRPSEAPGLGVDINPEWLEE